MTGRRFIRMTSAHQSGSMRSSSGGTTGSLSSPSPAVPHTFEARSSVSGSLIEPSSTFVPQVDQIVSAPCLPQRFSSWLTEWATAVISTPLPAESDSITGRSTGQTWVTSSRAISSGGSRRR